MNYKNPSPAEQYDLEHFSKKEDITFWLKMASKYGSPILEIGCGTGRITILIAKEGYEIYGIDKAAFMLEHLRRKAKKLPKRLQKNIKTSKEDMRRFNINKKFPLIITPFNTFLNLLNNEERISFLSSAKNHLEPEGKLILDISNPKKGNLKPTKTWTLEKTNKLPGGFISKRYYKHIEDKERNHQLFIKFRTFLEDTEGNAVSQWDFDYNTACLEPKETRKFLGSAGFKIEKIYGNYDQEAYETLNDPERQIIICQSSK